MKYILANMCKAFKSTLPQGERLLSIAIFLARTKFKSTLPQGERPFAILALTEHMTFKSTLPQGERHDGYFLFSLRK